MAQKKATAEAENNDSVADKIAVFIGQSVGELVNRKNALLKEIAGIDEEMRKITGRVSKQLGRYLPANVPLISNTEGPKKRGRPAGSAKGKRKRAPMSEETKAKMRAAAQKRWAGKGKKESGDKVGNG